MKVATDYVVCEVVSADEGKPYVLEGNQADQNARMKVVGVGPEVTACAEGDKIVAYGNQFQGFLLEGQQRIVLHNSDVVAVIE